MERQPVDAPRPLVPASGGEAMTALKDVSFVYRIGCGCRVEWSLIWQIVHRCKRHPSGPIPVRTMSRA
jgi:hypothetical protein